MVVFINFSKTPKNQFITILSHVDEPIEEGITLAVLPFASFIYSSSPIDVSRTPHLSQWWSESSRELYDPSKRDSHPVQSKIFTLRSSLHSGVNYTGLFPLLARRISIGEAHWATSSRAPLLQYTREFSYIPKYPKPPNRRSLRRSVRGKLSHNPRGIITTYRNQCRTEDEEAPFRILKVSEKAKEETWLAALLSCWLGEFVFPSKEANLIRPSIFKVASSMARGKKYCLAVPVLATIYKGLNDIASSSIPSKCDTTFPAHYLNAWLAEYFATHFDLAKASPLDPYMVRFSGEGTAKYFEEAEARKLFHSITKFKFYCLALFKGHQEILEDNDQLSDSHVDYFISQRPSYLSSRRGNLSVLEPYSPHRFGRQFSDPSLPNGDIGPSKLIVKLKQCHESDEPSKHREDNKLSLRISEGTDWTSDIVSTFRGADRAIAYHAKKLNKEDGILCSDHGNEVSRNDSDRHRQRRKYEDNVVDDVNHEIVMKTTKPFIDVDMPSPFLAVGVDSLKEVDKRQSPADGSPSMSEFSVQGLETFDLATKVIDKLHLEKSNASIPSSGSICNPTKDMVSKVHSSGVPTTSIVSILNAEDVISKASRHYAFMIEFGSLWRNASQYSSIRSALKQRISLEVKNQRRADAERRYTLALKSEAIEARDSSIAEAELSKVLSRETELRKELELLVTQRGKLENSISLHEEKLSAIAGYGF
uniref:Aminotransferase-like plant mobile domain-containing protein n=1 Tax=Fagus sylvatica TaxID=28930 RepID=A0A2N9GRV8_FAGSY